MARWINVDDTDSNIQYSGAWLLDNGKDYDTQGNFGATYLSSLHTISGGEGGFSYDYDGADGAVFGTINVKTSNGVQDPIWDCKVDDTTIALTSPFQFTENNWILCSWDSSVVPAGKHTVTVTVTSKSQAFLFDYFRFIPSSGANYQGAAFYVNFDDPAIQYGDGWQDYSTIGRMATNAGAVLTFPFYGTGVMWYGDTPTEWPHGSTTAEYAIDGKSPTTFDLSGNPGSSTQYSQLVFQTGSLSLGWHNLTVTSQGTTSVTPLVLAGLVIQGGSTQPPSVPSGSTTGSNTEPPSSTSSTSSISPSSSVTSFPAGARTSNGLPSSSSGSQTSITAITAPSDAASSNGNNGDTVPTMDSRTTSNVSHPPVGEIIGGVLGGLVVILLVLAFLYYRRRTKNRELAYSEQARPFYSDIPPSSPSQGPDSGSYGPQQATQMGSIHGVLAEKHVRAASSSYYGNDPFLISSTPGSHTGSRSAVGSSASLLDPKSDTSNQSEHLARRAITHEDSGYRMPQSNLPPPPLEIAEYPPVYTPA